MWKACAFLLVYPLKKPPELFHATDFILPPGALRATLDIGPSMDLARLVAKIADEALERKKAFGKKVYLHQGLGGDEHWSAIKPGVVTKVAVLINEEVIAPKVTKKSDPAV